MNFLTVQSKVLFSIWLCSLICSSDLFRYEDMEIASHPKVECFRSRSPMLRAVIFYLKALVQLLCLQWYPFCCTSTCSLSYGQNCKQLQVLQPWRDESGVFVSSLASYQLGTILYLSHFPFGAWRELSSLSSSSWLPAYPVWAWISLALFSCWSHSCPRVRWAWSWSGGLREILQAVSSAAADECGWVCMWEQKSSLYFATGCFGSPRAVFLASLCLPFLKVK